MSEKNSFPSIITHETDLLVLGGGASGCGAAFAAREAGLRTLLVEKGKLESSGCIGGGNDHFMGVLNTDAPYDTVDDMVNFFCRPGSPFLPETVRQWGGAMPHIIAWLTRLGVQFRKKPDGNYLRTQGFGQPGHWWILIREGFLIKPLIAASVRAMGTEVLDHVMITKMLTHKGRFAGAMGYNVLTGEFHLIRAKCAVLALGPYASRDTVTSTGNPFNNQSPPSITGAHYVLASEIGARILDLDQPAATLLPKSFGCPGMNGLTGEGGLALNYKEERYMEKYHPMGEQAPRNIFVQASFKEQNSGNGPPFYIDLRQVSEESRQVLSEELMPGDKATWPEFAKQKGIDFKEGLLEVEVGHLGMTGQVQRDACFESTVPGLYVGCGFPAFSGAMCGGYLAAKHAAKGALNQSLPPFAPQEEAEEERQRVMQPLGSSGETSYQLFEQAIRQVMMYYMGYLRNERGMDHALASLERIATLQEDLHADNFHELMRTHEAMDLLKMCRMTVLCCREHRETSPKVIYQRTDYPEADPRLQRPLAIEKVEGQYQLTWM